MANESLQWIFTPLRCVKTSDLKRYDFRILKEVF